MLDYDRSNFIAYLTGFPEQITETLKFMEKFSVNLNISGIHNIVITGMGGSAISGDLFLAYIYDELKVPTYTNRDYTVPAFVDKHTLFIASSYSGDTEETLEALKEAAERSAVIICITSGGLMEQFCEQGGHPCIKIPGNLPPRQALGYLFFSLVSLFQKPGFIAPRDADIEETRKLLYELADRYNPETSFGNNLANHIAQSIYHAIPIVYTGVPFLYPVPVRWRNQFNENAKSMSFSNVLPELNHNEIMGWEGLPEVNKHFRVILLRDRDEAPRSRKRIAITKEILKNKKILFGEVFAEGHSRLARLFSLIFLGDWASYYWAMLNEKDPISIDSIDILKRKLSEAEA